MGLLILFLRIMLIVVVVISSSMMPRRINYPPSMNFLCLMTIFLPVASLEDWRTMSMEAWINMEQPKMLYILSNLRANIESITMVNWRQDIEWLKKTRTWVDIRRMKTSYQGKYTPKGPKLQTDCWRTTSNWNTRR